MCKIIVYKELNCLWYTFSFFLMGGTNSFLFSLEHLSRLEFCFWQLALPCPGVILLVCCSVWQLALPCPAIVTPGRLLTMTPYAALSRNRQLAAHSDCLHCIVIALLVDCWIWQLALPCQSSTFKFQQGILSLLYLSTSLAMLGTIWSMLSKKLLWYQILLFQCFLLQFFFLLKHLQVLQTSQNPTSGFTTLGWDLIGRLGRTRYILIVVAPGRTTEGVGSCLSAYPIELTGNSSVRSIVWREGEWRMN